MMDCSIITDFQHGLNSWAPANCDRSINHCASWVFPKISAWELVLILLEARFRDFNRWVECTVPSWAAGRFQWRCFLLLRFLMRDSPWFKKELVHCALVTVVKYWKQVIRVFVYLLSRTEEVQTKHYHFLEPSSRRPNNTSHNQFQPAKLNHTQSTKLHSRIRFPSQRKFNQAGCSTN